MTKRLVSVLSGAALLLLPLTAFAQDVADWQCEINGEMVPCDQLGPMVGVFAGLGIGFMFVWFILCILMIVGMWKAFAKAGHPGWAAIVPIYNVVVMLQIARKPVWWILLMFIPLVNIVIAILATHAFAKAYGQGVGFTLGLMFLPFIFYPVLGFGKAQYQSGASSTPAAPTA